VTRILLGLLASVAIGGVPAVAHHSFAAEYFEEQSVSIEGELVQFEYRSPHSWVHVMVRDESGAGQQFSAEWASPTRLTQRGVTAETLRPGDRLVITGSPGRNPADRRIHLKSIMRPADGWAWSGPRTQR
jgi:hypothetical protein